MTDVLERLEIAFADRHTIERELGSGGMAVVSSSPTLPLLVLTGHGA